MLFFIFTLGIVFFGTKVQVQFASPVFAACGSTNCTADQWCDGSVCKSKGLIGAQCYDGPQCRSGNCCMNGNLGNCCSGGGGPVTAVHCCENGKNACNTGDGCVAWKADLCTHPSDTCSWSICVNGTKTNNCVNSCGTKYVGGTQGCTSPVLPPVLNPGFEEGQNSWASWDQTGGSLIFDTNTYNGGVKSARIQLGPALTPNTNQHIACLNQGRGTSSNSATDTTGYNGYFQQSQYFGKSYNMSYWYKTSPGVSTGFAVALKKADGTYNYSYEKGNFSGDPSSDWKHIGGNITIPSTIDGQNVVAFDISLCASSQASGPTGGNAQAWFDDVAIAEITRPNYCQSANIITPNFTSLSAGKTMTIASTAKPGSKIAKFSYYFYNLENKDSNNQPLAIWKVENQHYSKTMIPAAPADTGAVDVSWDDLNFNDQNWVGGLDSRPKKIQVNAYFTDSLSNFSAPEAPCVVKFIVDTTPIAGGTPTPTVTPGGPTLTPVATITSGGPSLTPVAGCPLKSHGDANCNGQINIGDYSIWLNSQCRTGCASLVADFNGDGMVDDDDLATYEANL